jgi:hypothetical protein
MPILQREQCFSRPIRTMRISESRSVRTLGTVLQRKGDTYAAVQDADESPSCQSRSPRVLGLVDSKEEGSQRGGFFALGFFLSVIGVVIAAAVSPGQPGPPPGMRGVVCPRCNARQNVDLRQASFECWQCKTVSSLAGSGHLKCPVMPPDLEGISVLYRKVAALAAGLSASVLFLGLGDRRRHPAGG